DQLFISGGSSRVVNLDTQLKERFSIPVEILNPFRQIDIAGAPVSGEWLTDNAPSLAVAVGLAIRHVGDEGAWSESNFSPRPGRPLQRRRDRPFRPARSSTTSSSSEVWHSA